MPENITPAYKGNQRRTIPLDQLEGKTQSIVIHLENGNTIKRPRTIYDVTISRNADGGPAYLATIEYDDIWIMAMHRGNEWEAHANRNHAPTPEAVAYREDLPTNE